MHVPFLQKRLQGTAWTLVPILVGALSTEAEARYGRVLGAYLSEPGNLFVASSDFCHWGRRFNYTRHVAADGPPHASVEALDREGMRLIEAGEPAAFSAYLAQQGNTICGRHPIGVLLHALKAGGAEGVGGRFVRYAQSSRAMTLADSSVSYASAAFC